MSNTDLCFLNVTELAPLVRARKISPVDIVQALLSRIDALNDDLLAYLHVSAASAMAAAQAAEIEIGCGGYRGPLHGIPVAYKDIYGDCLREPSWRFTLCPASSMPSNNAKRLLSCCFMVSEHL